MFELIFVFLGIVRNDFLFESYVYVLGRVVMIYGFIRIIGGR